MLNKRGISQQIATVLLVSFIIILLLIVFLWGRNYIQERAEKQGKLVEKQLECENIGIEIVNAYQQGNNVIITLKNTKDRTIGKFIFRAIGQETQPIENYDLLDSLSIRQYSLEYPEDIVRNLENIDVIPWLRVAQGVYVPCSNKQLRAKILPQ